MYEDDKPIVMAKEALKVFIHSLPPGSKFNVCSFGLHHEFLFNEAAEYNEENMKKAIKDADTYPNYDMGGTDIYTPLVQIFRKRSTSGMKRQIFILTDGAVWNTQSVIDLIQINAIQCKTRVHTFGIGGASPDLVKNAASAGAGSYHFIYNLK